METQQLTVDRTGLARILHRSPLTVARQMSSAPGTLPPHVPGTKPRIWRIETIDQWLRNREKLTSDFNLPASGASSECNVREELVKRKPGRPRKSANKSQHHGDKIYRSSIGKGAINSKEAPQHY